MLCCLPFSAVKMRSPLLVGNTVVTSVVTLLLGMQLMKRFPPWCHFLFFFHLSCSIPCKWAAQWPATLLVFSRTGCQRGQHSFLDPISKRWNPRGLLPVVISEGARKLTLSDPGGLGVQFHIPGGVGRAWHRGRGVSVLHAGMGCWSLTGGRRLFHEVGARGRSGLMWSVGDCWGEKAFSARVESEGNRRLLICRGINSLRSMWRRVGVRLLIIAEEKYTYEKGNSGM